MFQYFQICAYIPNVAQNHIGTFEIYIYDANHSKKANCKFQPSQQNHIKKTWTFTEFTCSACSDATIDIRFVWGHVPASFEVFGGRFDFLKHIALM